MSLTIGELTGFIRADDSGMRRGLSEAELRMRGFQRDMDGRLRHISGRFASESERMALGLGDAARDGDRLGGSLGRVGSLVGPVAGVAGQAAMMALRLGAAVPVAAALVSTLANIAPAAGVGASAVFMLAQAVAVVKIGSAGVGGAISAAFKDAGGAAGGAAGQANQYAQAQRAVKDAVQQAAYANEQAVRRVTDAERALKDAQVDTRRAQQDLNEARRQGARDLQDLNAELTDAHLDERQAILDKKDAAKELEEAIASGDPEEIERAQLAYDRATQSLIEAQTETQRLTEDTAKANAAGVEGTEAVVSAKEHLAQAERAAADRARDLSDAQTERNRTAAQGLENIRRAQEALNQSMSSGGGGGGGVDAFAEAMAKLAPSAQAFVYAIIALKPAWDALKLQVQERLFSGLAEQLTRTARATLPVLRTNLVSSAGAMNLMARGVLTAARELATSGTLGKAMASASTGLHNLSGVPGVLVTALTQVAAAAGPAFERLTETAGSAAARLGERLGEAFESGRMQEAIETAIDLIGDLAEVGGNVGSILASVFQAAQASGGGMIGVLQQITGSLADAFAAPEMQAGLKALFATMSVLAKTVGPLLVEALKVIGPVLTELGPPVQMIIRALGTALTPIIRALGPVLAMAARAFGALVVGALLPMLPPLSLLVSSLLPSLVPILEALVPASEAWSEVLVALTPLLIPMIIAASRLAAVLSTELAATIKGVVVPALKMVAALLRGDFSRALEHGKAMVRGMTDAVRRQFVELPGRVWNALQMLGNRLATRMNEAGGRLKARAAAAIGQAAAEVGRLPGRARAALGDLGYTLWSAGVKLIAGFIGGMLSKARDVKNAVSGILDGARDYFPFSPARTGPFSGRGWTLYAGRAISESLATGLTSRQAAVAAAARSVLGAAHGALSGPGASLGGVVPGAGTGAVGVSAAAGVHTLRVVLEIAGGTEEMRRMVRKWVRVEGGTGSNSVQLAIAGG